MCRGVTPNGTVLSRLLDGIAQCLTRGRFLPQPCFDQRRINEKKKKTVSQLTCAHSSPFVRSIVRRATVEVDVVASTPAKDSFFFVNTSKNY